MSKYGFTFCNKILLKFKRQYSKYTTYSANSLEVYLSICYHFIFFFFFVCALDMFCRFQELHNFLLSSFCVSTLNLCPWQFAWEGAHFSGFSLRGLLDPSFRAHCSPWAPAVIFVSTLGIYFIVHIQSVIVLFTVSVLLWDIISTEAGTPSCSPCISI